MNRTTKGIAFAVATALISGVAIFLNSFAVKVVSDAALFTTLKNGVAVLALLGIAAAAVRRPALPPLSRRSWAGMMFVGVFGGGLAFLLFFSGLGMASAPSAAFIHKTLFVWVALLAVPFLGERLGLLQVGALGALLASQLLITPPNGVIWGTGETLIAAATLLWAVEVVIARRLLKQVDPLALGVGRLGIGLVVLVGYLAFSGKLPLVAQLPLEGWLWILLTGVVLAGYVATWFAALSRAPATVVTSVLVLGAPITAVLAALANGTVPAALPLLGYGLIVAAAATLVITALRRSPPAQLEPATA
jgi:drug/metabolite transporter (DMT)-like permease